MCADEVTECFWLLVLGECDEGAAGDILALAVGFCNYVSISAYFQSSGFDGDGDGLING